MSKSESVGRGIMGRSGPRETGRSVGSDEPPDRARTGRSVGVADSEIAAEKVEGRSVDDAENSLKFASPDLDP